MARPAINMLARVSNIYCFEEADGPGDAEPYLWTVFFKIDGESFSVDQQGLIGFPTTVAVKGEHGNLDNDDVGEDERVSVPEAAGSWQTLLKPIPVNDPSFRAVLGDDVPAIVGIVVVLMEEDGWPGDVATTGYNALVDAVQLGVAKAAASFQHSQPTDEDIAEQIELIKEAAPKMVRGAILNHLSGAQVAWYGSLGNNDDQIGTEAWTVTMDDLLAHSYLPFERRWDDDESDGNGDWKIGVFFRNLDAPLPPPDPQACQEIAEQIATLEDELTGDIDINERKRILRALGALRGKARAMGC